MSNHERFEELCAMAAAGEISGEDLREFQAHLEDCPSCEKAFTDMKNIHAVWLPERKGFEIKRSPAAESRLRQAILEQATAAGARFSPEAQSPEPPVLHLARRPSGPAYLRAFSVAAVLLIAVVGVGTVRRINPFRPASPSSRSVSSVANQPSADSGAEAFQLQVLREQDRQMQAAQEKLETTLKKAQADRERLEQQVQEANQRASTLGEQGAAALHEVADLQSQLDLARANESKAEEQLTAIKAAASDKDSHLLATELENKELRNKLDEQVASVDREKDLMADGREIRNLIAARNLHIIDVYDTNGAGRTQKSFGRVFYTEGKSLVFYAYDLPARRPETKYAFYAWGKRDASEQGVRSLGIFYIDDQTQKRWVLNVTDPHVLSEIDSVFVTLEPADNPANHPSGRKLLSAYLGTPANHP
jgi:hypothetical protein